MGDNWAGERGSISAAAAWVESLFLGSVSTSFAILGIAAIGMGMLTGRVSMRSSGKAAIGCFILVGASVIAHEFMQLAQGSTAPATAVIPASTVFATPLDQQPEAAQQTSQGTASGNPFDPNPGSN